jgi:predicted ATP-dependent endonuclease of OLD family
MQKLFIKKIEIENFKTIKKLNFIPNTNFNIIIGKNNIGKSTIFEAILLWERCYNLIIQSNKKQFYNLSGTLNQYLSFQDLDFLRIIDDRDLFFSSSNTSKITVTINDGIREFELGISIIKPSTIKNSFFRISTVKQKSFEEFSSYAKEKNKKLDEIIFIYQTRPIANVLQKEPFLNVGKIKKKIENGLSQEVLRNKILTKTPDELRKLEENISYVIEQQISFSALSTNQRKNDEYINLKINGKDIHLQGSGLLQIIEILSTINYIDAPLNVLLVDEPDSHIHSHLQTKLMRYLKSITNNQTFVISHNDSFVNNAEEGEVFYLNDAIKASGYLSHLELKNFDLIKKDLGGIIIGLTKINNAKKIVFVEGDDDAMYIKQLIQKFISLTESDFDIDTLTFYQMRGKDYLQKKVEHVKRVLGQIFTGKTFICVYDKDFCTLANANNFNASLERTMTSPSKALYHNGYCIESVLFSDIDKLSKFLWMLTPDYMIISLKEIKQFVEFYKKLLLSQIKFIGNSENKQLNLKFKGQKKDSRPELQNIEFTDFIVDAGDNLHFYMNKAYIKDFIDKFENTYRIALFDKLEFSDDFYASSLFALYRATCKFNPEIFQKSA